MSRNIKLGKSNHKQIGFLRMILKPSKVAETRFFECPNKVTNFVKLLNNTKHLTERN